MLALIEFALIPIPVVFYLYGHKIREKSVLIRQMRDDRVRAEGKKRRAAERAERAMNGVAWVEGADAKTNVEV